MSADRIYDRYIDALLSLLADSAARKTALDGIQNFTAALQVSPEFLQSLTDPRVRKTQKEGAVSAIGDYLKLNVKLKNTLALLVRQGRAGELPSFAKRLEVRLKTELGTVTADITAATALTAAQEADLKKSLGGDVELNTRIDPSILGGLIVKVGSWRMDDSVRGKLDRLARALTKAA